MRCRTARTKLQALVDGALSPAEESRVRDHLAACQRCRRHLNSLRLVAAALLGQPAAQPSPEFASAIIARARAQRDLRQQRVLVPVWLEGWTLASVALGLAACGLVVSRYLAVPARPGELIAHAVGAVPVTLTALFGFLAVWYYRA